MRDGAGASAAAAAGSRKHRFRRQGSSGPVAATNAARCSSACAVCASVLACGVGVHREVSEFEVTLPFVVVLEKKSFRNAFGI